MQLSLGNKVQMRLSERRGLSQKIFFPLWLNIKVQGKYNSNIQLHTEDRRKIQARQNRGRRGVRKMLEWRRLNATANNIQRVRNFHFSIVVERGAQEMGHYITLSITLLYWWRSMLFPWVCQSFNRWSQSPLGQKVIHVFFKILLTDD